MIDEAYNPDDPLFLVSRDLDRDLDDAGRRRVREALASSPELGREVESLRKVDRLLARWAGPTAQVDQGRFVSDVRARLAASEDDAADVDRLVARWAAKKMQVNERAFADRVMRRLREQTRSRRAPRILLRIGAPLAAAAAIFIALTTGLWYTPTPERVVIVKFERRSSGSQTVASRAVVSYGRRTTGANPADLPEPGVAFTTVGVSSSVTTYEEGPPL